MAKTITWKTKGNGKKGRAKKGQKMCNPHKNQRKERAATSSTAPHVTCMQIKRSNNNRRSKIRNYVL